MSDEVRTITLTVVQVGQDKTYIEVPEGTTFADVLDQVGGAGKKVTNRGQDISEKASEPVQANDQLFVGPKAAKQG